MNFPLIAHTPKVFYTANATPYLCEPGVALIAEPKTHIQRLEGFLGGFEGDFVDYTKDDHPIDDGANLCKTAGQLCYMSFGEKRTKNKDADHYFENIKSSGHGSVLEHANYSLLFYGIGRDVTHELVRHRAGFGFSQVSQRYVASPRFVERKDQATDPILHAHFLNWIDAAVSEYEFRTARLLELQTEKDKRNLSKTDLRKRVRQSSRSCLPNETEAPILVTANARAWRHFIEMRANEHADVAIRLLATRVLEILKDNSPLLFGDYTLKETHDGLHFASTEHRKV